MGECNVKVVVRFRPFNEREKQENVDSDLSVDFPDASTVQVLQGGKLKNTFLLDRVLTPTVTQDEVFDVTARATVEDIVNGYNGTIFAFGQTGAGKSFSMFGPDITSPNRGIIPRACGFIFDYIRAQASAEMEITIKCSFLEIYREAVRDLLNPNSNNLKVRETPTRGVWVDDLTEQYVSNEKEVIDLLKLGEKFRSVSATQMNAVSSRSHSLFVLTLHQKGRDGSSRTGKLNLADLAGSEKVEKTGAKGDTLEEAKKINQSLSALGNCINALTKAKRGHIPYRDSKLTFLLRESLGGNSKTTLIVCCSAHKFNMEETISSLQFAQRAKSIKNTVKVNRQRSVEEMNRIINKLSKELELLKAYCQTLENEVLKLNPKFDIASIKKSAIPVLQPSAPSPSTAAPSIGGFISNMFGSASGSPASSIRDDASDMSFDEAPEMNFGDRPLEELTLVELQVELEKSRETATLQIREHAEEIENLKDENETFRHNISTLEEENKSEKTAKTLLKNQLEAEQAKNGARINKLEYENKQLLLEMEAIKEAQTNLESQNKALQDSLKKERDVREKRMSRVMSTQEILVSSPLSSSGSLPQMSPRNQPTTTVLQQVSPRKPLPAQQPSSPQAQAAPTLQLETKDIKETKPTESKPTDTKPTDTKPTTKPTETKPTEPKPTEAKETTDVKSTQIDTTPKQPENPQIEETKPQTNEPATKLSLEDLLQQADPEADKETLQMLANDLGSLQLELNGAKSEISAMNKKLENKETRIEQLEAELQKKNDTEAELRKTLETAVQEADAKEADFKSRIYYMEEAARVAKQRESAVRVVRPVEVKQQNIATGFLSSFFEPINKDIPAANSLTHCFKQGFLTKQGSRIKTWKKRFAILQGNTLFYYTPDPKKEARGKFELDSLCVVQEADDFTSKSLSLGIFHPLKQPFFCTVESQQDRLEWIEALRAACTVVPMLD